MVVGAEHIDGAGVAAFEFVCDICDIASDVGGIPIRFDDDPVLVVAVVGAAEPPGTVTEVQVAVFFELVDGAVDGAGFKEGILVEVHIEVDTEFMESSLDVIEHEFNTEGAEGFAHVGFGLLEHPGFLGHNIGGNFGDVVPTVAVFGDGLAFGGGDEGVGEPVDLAAVIVEIIFAGHVGAAGGEDSAEGVAHGGPPGAAQVDGSGRVGGNEFQVDAFPAVEAVVPIGSAGGEDVGHDLALGGGSQSDVNESRAGDVDGGDLVMRRQGVDKQAGKLARIHSYLLGNLERQVGGIVAVLRIARAFHDHLLGQDGHVQLSIGKYLVGLSVDEGGKIRWCHNATV